MAGRVPVNAAAITMRAEPGMELACRGKNFNLPPGPRAQPRGVLSHYAAATLPQADTMGDWLARIHAAAQADQDAGALPYLYGLDLEVAGRPEIPLHV
jgi:hypothetical protein